MAIMKDRCRIIVSGLLGLHPVGGMAWHYLQYLIGFARLGHDVYYHEDTWSWPFHPVENRHTSHGEYSAEYINGFLQRYAPDLCDRWHYLHLHEQSFGMDRAAFNEVAKTADLFLNVSGACFIPDGLAPGCIKIFLDTDPGYNQIVLSERFEWSENVERWAAGVEDHDRHFTFAENIHDHNCLIPHVGLNWQTTRMPAILELWQPLAEHSPPESTPWTTVMTWNAFKGPLVFQGVEYKSKGSEFEKFLTLPQRTRSPLRVAVGGVKAPLPHLRRHGWDVIDGPVTTRTPDQYQAFIRESRGEFSTAKNVYVAMRSGWFSERSVCYLAAGRPVVVQDTGFSSILPCGHGLLTFNSLDEAVAAIDLVEKDYDRQAKAALEIAHAYFDSQTILPQLIDDAVAATDAAPHRAPADKPETVKPETETGND
jgi:hypothetical protein